MFLIHQANLAGSLPSRRPPSRSDAVQTTASTDFAQARRNMVDGQLRTFDVTDRAVLAAMEEVPREAFVPAASRPLAYSDLAIDLGMAPARRAMLPPMVLGRMLQALDVEVGMRILDVGSGGGYGSAVLARLGASVTALETDAEVAAGAGAALGLSGVAGVTQRVGPLEAGSPGDGPFDAVLVNGAVEAAPETLIGQLTATGRLVCLVQEGGRCVATLFVRSGDALGRRALFDAAAPLLQGFLVPRSFTF